MCIYSIHVSPEAMKYNKMETHVAQLESVSKYENGFGIKSRLPERKLNDEHGHEQRVTVIDTGRYSGWWSQPFRAILIN